MFPVWLLGVLLAITASVISNLGLNLQKRAHMNMDARKEKEKAANKAAGRPRTSSMSVSLTSTSRADAESEKNAKHTNGTSQSANLKKPAASNGNGNNGSKKTKGEYVLMDTDEDAQVARDEVRRQEGSPKMTTMTATNGTDVAASTDLQPAQVTRQSSGDTPALSVVAGSSLSSSGGSSSESPHFHPATPASYTPQFEISQGAITLDTFNGATANGKKNATTKAAAAAKAANKNGSSSRAQPTMGSSNNNGRARSSSAAVGGQSSSRSSGGRHSTSGGSSRNNAASSSSSIHSHRRRTSLMAEGAAAAAAEREVARASKPKESYTKQPLWVVGLCCVIGGSLFDFAALAFVDQAVVAPLGSLTLVSNVFFSPLLLGERVNRKQLYCTFLIISGSCLAVAFAPHSDASPDIQAMFDNFTRPRFIVYAGAVVASLVGLRLLCHRFGKIRRNDPRGAYPRVEQYHTFCYAACAGIMGAQSVLFAKCTAMLLAASIAGDGLMFVYWGTYFVLLGLGVTIFLQIRWLNSGLKMFSALMIVPIFQSFWILVSVIAGMIFFGEYAGVFNRVLNGVLFPFGLLLTVVGVYFLTRIASPGSVQVEDGHAASHKKRRHSVAHRGSVSGININAGGSSHVQSSLSTTNTPGTEGAAIASAAASDSDSIAAAAALAALVGTSSSPLLLSQVSVADNYLGVPQTQSPREQQQLQKQIRRERAAARSPVNGMPAPGVERSVEVGSYDKEDSNLAQPSGTGGEDDDLERGSGSGSNSGSGSASSSDDEEDPSSSAARRKFHNSDYAVHSMAPLNFPAQFIMKLLPSAFTEDDESGALSPRGNGGAYFEQNSSGFEDSIGGGDGRPGDISLGGLPYASIFRVREEREEEDMASPQASPQQSPQPSPGNNAAARRSRQQQQQQDAPTAFALNGSHPSPQHQPSSQEWAAPTNELLLSPSASFVNASSSVSSSTAGSSFAPPRHPQGSSHASTITTMSSVLSPSAYFMSSPQLGSTSASHMHSPSPFGAMPMSAVDELSLDAAADQHGFTRERRDSSQQPQSHHSDDQPQYGSSSSHLSEFAADEKVKKSGGKKKKKKGISGSLEGNESLL